MKHVLMVIPKLHARLMAKNSNDLPWERLLALLMAEKRKRGLPLRRRVLDRHKSTGTESAAMPAPSAQDDSWMERLDGLEGACCASKVVDGDQTTDSDPSSSPDVDRLLCSLASRHKLGPLTSQEIQAYLADISRPHRHQSAEQPLNEASNGHQIENKYLDPEPPYLAAKAKSPVDCRPPGLSCSQQLKYLARRDLTKHLEQSSTDSHGRPVPTNEERNRMIRSASCGAHMLFHAATGLPMQSSPAPVKKRTSGKFDFDDDLSTVRSIKNSLSCLSLDDKEEEEKSDKRRPYSTSAPAATPSSCLLGNFEESVLNGRIQPSGFVSGFRAEIGASGSFCPKHVTLPVMAAFFNLSEDNAPSPYLGYVKLDDVSKRGYHVPKAGTIQVTLFNPNQTVVKMFVVMYNLSNMPPQCQTFVRQRIIYKPVEGGPSDVPDAPVYLRYLVHLRLRSSKSDKVYLHTDIRMIFARDKLEFDSRVANYEMVTVTTGPKNPKFSS